MARVWQVEVRIRAVEILVKKQIDLIIKCKTLSSTQLNLITLIYDSFLILMHFFSGFLKIT